MVVELANSAKSGSYDGAPVAVGARCAAAPASDAEWIQQIRQGDEAAFEALFRAYHQDLVRFVRSYVGRLAVAEELVQDIFCSIWQRRKELQPGDALGPYLYGAAKNQANSYLRHDQVRNRYRAERRQEGGRSATGETPAQALWHKELSAAVERAIEAMPPRRRRVYKLSRKKGLSYAEISGVMDISKNTVEVHMVDALKFLRARVSELL